MGKMRIVVITGTCGVGKTETAQRLIHLFPEKSALLETDALVGQYPFRVAKIDEAFHALVVSNLRNCINTYRQWGTENLLICGVVVPGGIYSELGDLLDDPASEWIFYGLQASEDTIKNRIIKDSEKLLTAPHRLQWFHLNEKVKEISGCRLIDTNNLTLDEVVKTIARSEGLLQDEQHEVSQTR